LQRGIRKLRVLYLGLILLNLAVGGYFIWANSFRSVSGDHQPLNSEKIILRSSEVSTAESPATPVDSLPATGVADICVEWKGLVGADFGRGRDALRNLAGEQALSFVETPLQQIYWVIFPPLPSRDAALAKLGEIKALGIDDAFVIKDGNRLNGISLGVFDNEDQARVQAKSLEGEGIAGLVVDARPKDGTAYYFLIRSRQPDLLKQIDKLRQAYPTSTLSRVDCPAS
jgi:hypothetical protein